MLKGLLKEKKAQAVVEFALITPILLWMIMAVAQIAIMTADYMQLNNAARVGARAAASIGMSDTEIKRMMKDTITMMDKEAIVMTFTPDDMHRHSGQPVTVSLHYDLPILVPIILVPDPFPLDTKIIMEVE